MNDLMNPNLMDYDESEFFDTEESQLQRRVHFSTMRDPRAPPTRVNTSSPPTIPVEQKMPQIVDDIDTIQVQQSRKQYRQAEQHEFEKEEEHAQEPDEEEYSEIIEEITSPIFSGQEGEHDVESLTEKLNDVSNYLRREVMAQYFDVKGKLHKKIQDQLRKMIHEKELIIEDRDGKIEKLQDSVKKRDYYLSRFKALVFRMTDSIAHIRQQERMKTLRQVCFAKWKQYIRDKRRRKNLESIAQKYYLKRIQRKVLLGWHMWIIQSKKNTMDSIWSLRLDTAVAEIKNDYEIKIEHMRQQIEILNAKLAHETKDKRILHENLKKALMRGVCAMNNQFLDIIKQTNDNNPVVTPLSQAEIEEVVMQQFTDGLSDRGSLPEEDDIPQPRDQIPAQSNTFQNVRQQPLPQQPYFPTQVNNFVPNNDRSPTSQFSGQMDAGELRNSQQKVRVTRNVQSTSRPGSSYSVTKRATPQPVAPRRSHSTQEISDPERPWRKF